MKKIEIDKKKIKNIAKKAIPWLIGGAVIAVGGVVVYKKGFINGTHAGMDKGMDLTIEALADFLTTPNQFAIYKNSSNIPVVFDGIAVHSTDDIEKAVKMLDVVSPSEGEDSFSRSVKQLTDIIFEGRPIKVTNF